MKQIYANQMVFGTELNKQPFYLKKITELPGNQASVTLSDKTGTVEGFVQDISLLAGVSQHIGKAVSVSGRVMPEKRMPKLYILNLQLTTDYTPSDLNGGLEPERAAELIAMIKEVRKKITHAGYLQLIDNCLTDEVLQQYAKLPATHGLYGTYLGGALAATCTVTYMVMSSMAAYVKRGNGFSTKPPKWNVLLTASLLHAYGMIDYCDASDPFRKTARGVVMDYFSTLQHSLESVIIRKNIPLTDMEIANLLNILNVAVSRKTSSRSVSKDGAILRSILFLYGECDRIDMEIQNHQVTEGEEFFYSPKLNRYLSMELNSREEDM